MKNKIKILFSLFIAIALFSLPISSHANEPISPIPWTYDDDGTLCDGNNTFVPSSLPFGYKLAHSPLYYYSSSVELPDEYTNFGDLFVVSYARDGKLVWLTGGLSNDGEPDFADIYVREDYFEAVNGFFNGNFDHLCIENSTHASDKFGTDIVSEIKNSSSDKIEISVPDLLKINYTIYPIRAYDETRAIYYNFGQFICEGENYYFIDYSELDNSYFNADGSFSYRSGTVLAYVISEEKIDRVENLIQSLTIVVRNFDYEEMPGEINIGFDVDTSFVILWICIVIFGFIAPLAMLFFGFYLPKTDKRRGERRWHVMIYAAIPWLIVSVMLTVIIIIS